MNAHSDGPTRALVLGGGGPVGIGWQTGLLTGLREAGLDLADAEVIVGTSAGSVVGALAAARIDFTTALTGLTGLAEAVDSTALVAGMQALVTALFQVAPGADPRQVVAEIAKAAEQADTMDEQSYLDLYAVVADTPWPKGFHCTVNDARTGESLVWGPDSGVPLRHAVAASCAVPFIYPPVSVNGSRYVDGGIVSPLNATAAPSTDRMVVISCSPLAATVPGMPAWLTQTSADELAAVGDARWLATVEPGGELADDLANMMNPRLTPQAFGIGLRQAGQELDRLAAVWTGERSSV